LPDEARQMKGNRSILEIRNVKRRNQGYYECLGRYNLSPHYPIFAAKSYLGVKRKLYTERRKNEM